VIETVNRLQDSWPGRSWYEDEFRPRPLPSLTGKARVDVAIIGGGLAGLSTAISLIERGVDAVAVLESGQPGTGASGRNGGFVFAGYSLSNERLIAQIGRHRARVLHGWTRDAVRLIRKRIDRYGIACQASDAGVLLADWFGDDRVLLNQAEWLDNQLGFGLEPVGRDRMADYVTSTRYGAGLLEPGSFHFHPLRHARGLADATIAGGGRVYGSSPVRSLDRHAGAWRLRTPEGELQADQVVLATGGYDRRLWPRLQRAVLPVATYIAVTEPLGEQLQALLPAPVAVYDTRFAFDYYRPLPDTRLLWGGRITMARRSPKAIRRLLRRDIVRVFPVLDRVRFEYAWGGWMSYARHQMPLLGRTAGSLWYALAFGGHGMATTTLAGEVLAEALTGERERLAAFADWPPSWAGGLGGRAAVQCVYWGLQARDQLRTRRLRRL